MSSARANSALRYSALLYSPPLLHLPASIYLLYLLLPTYSTYLLPPSLLLYLPGGSVGILPGVPSWQTQAWQSSGWFLSLRRGIGALGSDRVLSWHGMCHQGDSRVAAGGMRCIAMQTSEALVCQGEAHRLAIPAAGCSICVSADYRPRPLLDMSRACKFYTRARRAKCVCPLLVSGLISISFE